MTRESILIEKLRADNAKLRSALVAFVGADGRQELEEMKRGLPLVPGEPENKAVAINAVQALLETL